MKISVIIASYNAEKYLVETLQSVVNQTLDDYEIITINDGSKDGTLDILKEYEKEYPNFTVISKENGGVSAARNDGLNVAQGKYVYFYDADDILELEALEKMYEAAENNKAELVIAGYDMFDQYKTTEVKELNSLLELEKIDKYDTDILKTFSLTNKLFRRDIIEKYAKSKNVSLTFADTALPTENGFIYKSKEYPLSLKGTYQPQNAAVVLEITSALNKQGFNISDEDISYGLSHTSWAARFEFVSDRVVIDGGHNIDGIKALKKSLLSLNRDIVLVIAMMEDKDYKACIREISPVAKAVFATQLDMPRCLSSEKISDIIGSMNIPVFVNNNPKDALQNALDFSDNSIVCVCGSLYLAGEIKKIFIKSKKRLANSRFIC